MGFLQRLSRCLVLLVLYSGPKATPATEAHLFIERSPAVPWLKLLPTWLEVCSMQPADAMWFRSHFAWQRNESRVSQHGVAWQWHGLAGLISSYLARSNCLACAGVSGRRGRKAALPLDAISCWAVAEMELAGQRDGAGPGVLLFLSLPLGEISVLCWPGYGRV